MEPNTLLKYVQAFMLQTAQTAIANARARIDERLARWILMADDRIRDTTLPFTHESLALMLGVRRGGRDRDVAQPLKTETYRSGSRSDCRAQSEGN